MHGEIRTRARTGCLSCRRRHYKCDERRPNCVNCARSRIRCIWGTAATTSRTASISPGVYDARGLTESSTSYFEVTAHRDSYASSRHGGSIVPPIARQQNSPVVHAIPTQEWELITFYTSHFHSHNYQLCEWTSLVALPRRTTIPNIVTIERRGLKKMTNWASYYLPHLSQGHAHDPLTLAISAFTALRMGDNIRAASIYVRALVLMRQILARKDIASIGGPDFLRIWATTLLMTEYECQNANQVAQYQHLDGATVLSNIAMKRFTILEDRERLRHRRPMSSGNGKSAVSSQGHITPEPLPGTAVKTQYTEAQANPKSRSTLEGNDSNNTQSNSKTERELPGYLLSLTWRLNTSRLVRAALDTVWPEITSPVERDGLGALHEKSNDCYRLLFPLLTAYYGRMEIAPPQSPREYECMMAEFSPKVAVVLRCVQEYQDLLYDLYQTNTQVYQSCARPGFPFSPIIKFVNPLMVLPVAFPHVVIVFLAPFVTASEHREAIRHVSGIFAGFQGVPGLMIDAAWPDLHIAAFWKRGEERDYFSEEFHRRGGDFAIVLTKIWGTIDMAEAAQNRLLRPAEILGISLRAYRTAQQAGMKLKNTRH